MNVEGQWLLLSTNTSEPCVGHEATDTASSSGSHNAVARSTWSLVDVIENRMAKQYEVALSFSGQQREYVRRVAEALRAAKVLLFYDEFEEASLWGKDLTEHLHHVYSESAKYCVIFISQEYVEGMWTTHEKRSAFEAALANNQEYILPARFDDSKLTGLPATTAYLDCRTRTPDDLAGVILRKVGKETSVPNATMDDVPREETHHILDSIQSLMATCRNGRVPIEALAETTGISGLKLRATLVDLYYGNLIEFHSGNRVSIASKGL